MSRARPVRFEDGEPQRRERAELLRYHPQVQTCDKNWGWTPAPDGHEFYILCCEDGLHVFLVPSAVLAEIGPL